MEALINVFLFQVSEDEEEFVTALRSNPAVRGIEGGVETSMPSSRREVETPIKASTATTSASTAIKKQLKNRLCTRTSVGAVTAGTSSKLQLQVLRLQKGNLQLERRKLLLELRSLRSRSSGRRHVATQTDVTAKLTGVTTQTPADDSFDDVLAYACKYMQ